MALVEIGSFADHVTAEMARGLLMSEGIHAILLGAGLASLGLGGIAPVQLMVEARDQTAASRILADISA